MSMVCASQKSIVNRENDGNSGTMIILKRTIVYYELQYMTKILYKIKRKVDKKMSGVKKYLTKEKAIFFL